MTVPLAEAMRDALAITAAEGALMTPHDRFRPVVYMGLQGEQAIAGAIAAATSSQNYLSVLEEFMLNCRATPYMSHSYAS
jgi:hypothetical protein